MSDKWTVDDLTWEILDKGDYLAGWCSEDESLEKCAPARNGDDCEGHYEYDEMAKGGVYMVHGIPQVRPDGEGWYFTRESAHLVSACPDLLAAAEAGHYFLGMLKDAVDDHGKPVLDKEYVRQAEQYISSMEQAIKKARGEAE